MPSGEVPAALRRGPRVITVAHSPGDDGDDSDPDSSDDGHNNSREPDQDDVYGPRRGRGGDDNRQPTEDGDGEHTSSDVEVESGDETSDQRPSPRRDPPPDPSDHGSSGGGSDPSDYSTMSTAESNGTYIDSTTELQQLVIEALRPGEGVFFNTDIFDDGTILVKISIAGQHEKASRLIYGINNFFGKPIL